jgi:hypothetical protein
MKIIKRDNFNREHIGEELVAENVPYPQAKYMVEALNEKYSGEKTSLDFFAMESNDYVPEPSFHTSSHSLPFMGLSDLVSSGYIQKHTDLVLILLDKKKNDREDQYYFFVYYNRNLGFPSRTISKKQGLELMAKSDIFEIISTDTLKKASMSITDRNWERIEEEENKRD